MVKAGSVDTTKMIKPATFVKVVKGDLKRGSIIYVAGLQALPVDEEDLYQQRLHIFGQRHLGKGKLESKMYVIDPSDVEKLSDKRNQTLLGKLLSHYNKVNAQPAEVAA